MQFLRLFSVEYKGLTPDLPFYDGSILIINLIIYSMVDVFPPFPLEMKQQDFEYLAKNGSFLINSSN